MSRAALVLLLLAVGSCGDRDPCEGVPDVVRGEAGLVLTKDEHGPGWGQEACFQCHQVWRIHRADCAEDLTLDLDRIRELADAEDPRTCARCHGANGVARLADAAGEGT